MIIDRRKLVKRMAFGMMAAPAIVRYASLMPVKKLPPKIYSSYVITNVGTFDVVGSSYPDGIPGRGWQQGDLLTMFFDPSIECDPNSDEQEEYCNGNGGLYLGSIHVIDIRPDHEYQGSFNSFSSSYNHWQNPNEGAGGKYSDESNNPLFDKPITPKTIVLPPCNPDRVNIQHMLDNLHDFSERGYFLVEK